MTGMLGPRTEGIVEAETKYMGIAILASGRSKDPSTQVGACLVSHDGRIIGTGYNGFPRGIDNYALPWDKVADSPEKTKYLYIAHAEENAVANCDKTRLKGSKMYVTLHPCNHCAICIVQHQIEEVIYLSDKYHDLPETIAARKILALANIKTRQFVPSVNKIEIDFRWEKWTCK